MSIRRENTTRLVGKKKKQIAWRVRWEFVKANQSVVTDNVLEESLPRTILGSLLKGRWNGVATKGLLTQYKTNEADADLIILFRDHSTSGKVFFKLDQDKSVRDNLARTTVIEYPTFIVVDDAEVKEFAIANREEIHRQFDDSGVSADPSASVQPSDLI